jgi:DNA polymerase-1
MTDRQHDASELSALDTGQTRDLHSAFANRVNVTACAAYEVIGKHIDLGSDQELQMVLFDELGLPSTGGNSTDTAALESLYRQTGHPFLAHLLAHRHAVMLKATADGLLT